MAGKKISVVVLSFNQKKMLEQAIESVLNQTCSPHEIIVCDDASTDGSVDLIKAYEKKYPGWIRGIFQPANLGISKNRNSGFLYTALAIKIRCFWP